MIRRWCGIGLLLLLAAGWVFAQTAPTVGLRENVPTVHAFIHARIVVAPGKIIANGTVVIRDGVIAAVGEKIVPPEDARIWDMKGRTLYPGLIDLSSDIGMPKAAQAQTGNPFDFSAQQQQQAEKPKGAAHWNAKMRADFRADEEFVPDPKIAEKLRSQGFALAVATPQRGIFRGMSALVNLGGGAASELFVKRRVAQTMSFEQSGGFLSGYPNSLMGIIAFIRQSYYDADWYRKAQEAYAKNPSGQMRPETNTALAALADAVQNRMPVVIDVANDLNFLRAAKIGKEFSLNLWIVGSGREYRRLNEVKSTKVPVIVPLNFPEAPSVESPEEALNVPLDELRYYDEAPENAGRLSNAGIPIALTTAQLKDPGTFLALARKAIERGLNPDAALSALTTTPAKWLGMEKELGTIEAGKAANIVVTDGDLFAEKTKVQEIWIDGKHYEVKPPQIADVRGVWEMKIDNDSGILTLRGDVEKPTGVLNIQGKNLRLASVTLAAGRVAIMFPSDSLKRPGTVLMSGTLSDKEMFGVLEASDGSLLNWHASRKEPARTEPDTAKARKPEMASFPVTFPPTDYGRIKLPEQPEHILVRNATIWTEGPQGKLLNADMLVTKGKITAIGKDLSAPADAVIIDATNKDLSPGITD